MKKKLNVLLLALAMVALSIGLIIAGTYAIFTEQISTTNHLQAGELKATLVREKLITRNLTADGDLEDSEDDRDKDFTVKTDDNIFGLTSETKIVPGSSFTAEMALTNSGDVAFYYWIEIKVDANSDESLAAQLKLTITPDGGTATAQYLSEGFTVGQNGGIATVSAKSTARFKVTILFEDIEEEENNKSQEKEGSFDLIVHAIQAV